MKRPSSPAAVRRATAEIIGLAVCTMPLESLAQLCPSVVRDSLSKASDDRLLLELRRRGYAVSALERAARERRKLAAAGKKY